VQTTTTTTFVLFLNVLRTSFTAGCMSSQCLTLCLFCYFGNVIVLNLCNWMTVLMIYVVNKAIVAWLFQWNISAFDWTCLWAIINESCIVIYKLCLRPIPYINSFIQVAWLWFHSKWIKGVWRTSLSVTISMSLTNLCFTKICLMSWICRGTGLMVSL